MKKEIIYKIYQPADLNRKWFVWWRIKGKRHYKYSNINQFKTKEERIKRAEEVIQELKLQELPENTQLQKDMNIWLRSKSPFWKYKSVLTYKSCLDQFFKYAGKRRITKSLVTKFFEEKSRRWSNTTYNKYRCKLGRIFKAFDLGHVIKDIEPVKEQRTPARYFQKHQIEQLKKEILSTDPGLWLFIEFIFYCFIRPGELRLLKYSDILFSEGKILIRSEISKNRKAQYIVIPSSFQSVVEDLKGGKGYIFSDPKNGGRPIGVNTMSTKHRKILKKLNFDAQYKLYSWKHTGAIMAVMNGVSVKELQLQLRHHSLDQVNDYLRQMGVFHMDGLKSNFPSL